MFGSGAHRRRGGRRLHAEGEPPRRAGPDQARAGEAPRGGCGEAHGGGDAPLRRRDCGARGAAARAGRRAPPADERRGCRAREPPRGRCPPRPTQEHRQGEGGERVVGREEGPAAGEEVVDRRQGDGAARGSSGRIAGGVASDPTACRQRVLREVEGAPAGGGRMEGGREGFGRALPEAVREVSQVGGGPLCQVLRGTKLPRSRPGRDGAGGASQAPRHGAADAREHPRPRGGIGVRADAPCQGGQRLARVLAGGEGL